MNWKTVLRSLKNRDMQKRMGIVFGLIVAFRFMAHIPVPLAEPTKLKSIIDNVVSNSDFGGFLNLMSGGALSQLSIVLVGMSPFITASIITQLLTKAIPKLEELHKDGESGRRKINQWTRIVSVPLAVIQSIAFIYILRQSVLAGSTAGTVSTSPIEWVVAVAAMTAGSVLLMWLGELITEQGIGNGISLVIFAGIISQLPTTLGSMITSLVDTSAGTLSVFGWFNLPVNPTAFWVVLGVSLLGLAMLYILVKINEAQRIITVNYAKRVSGNTSYGGIKSILPVKLIAAGVIPVIFASIILSLPSTVFNYIQWGNTQAATNAQNWLNQIFTYSEPIGFFLYIVLIFVFSFFYSFILINPEKTADNLQKQNAYIPGYRPGSETESYITKVLFRVTVIGALYLVVVASLPIVTSMILGHDYAQIGGTGLLIIVGVALETARQIETDTQEKAYAGFMR